MEHKPRSLISAAIVFLSLLFPLRFVDFFWYFLIGSSAIASLLVFWVFGEKPNLKRLKEDWFTIVFVAVFTASMGVFGYLVPNPIVQALVLGTTGLFLYFLYIIASRLKRGYTPSLFLRNITSFAALLGIFFSVSDILRWYTVASSSTAKLITIAAVFVAVFIISEFLFEVQKVEKSILYSLIIAFSITQIVWVSLFWLITYPQSERASNIGVPLPAILSTVFFYLFWGLSHHRLEGTLTKKILWEYIFMAGSFILILMLTASWLPLA